MKHLVPFFLCMNLFTFTAKAQYVTIPDPNLRFYMQTNFSACFNGANMLDTTCPAVVNAQELYIEGFMGPISDWDGFQYFKNVQIINFSYISTYPSLPTTLRRITFQTCGGTLPALPNGLTHLIFNWSTTITSLPALPNSLIRIECTNNTYLNAIGSLPTSLKYLDCSLNGRLSSLPALPGSLDTLKCSDDSLSTIPVLPASLKYLDCKYNRLTALPALPAQLKYLNANSNFWITSLPATLPSQLEYLDLGSAAVYSGITSFPALPSTLLYLDASNFALTSLPALPSTLQTLNCQNNQLTSIPTLPAGLTMLACDWNSITVLPAIPTSVTTLSCNRNQLIAIPTLPPVLQYFGCGYNHLTSLPALPNTIINLGCDENQLTSLPTLPAGLTTLSCFSNQLTSLPALPNTLMYLECYRNQLNSLPDLPGTLTELKCQGNHITCMPVIPPAAPPFFYGLNIDMDDIINCVPNLPEHCMLGVWSADLMNVQYYFPTSPPYYPLCSAVNNSNHCDAFPLMAGQVFNDNNNNSTRDANEPYRPNVKVELSNGDFTFSNNNGYYQIPAPDTGTYTITVTPPNYFTSVPLQYNYHFNSFDTLVTGNFALQPTVSIDSLSIDITVLNAARPGFSFPYVIAYTNAGTTTLSPNIVFNYDNTRLLYDSSSNASVINIGNSLTLSQPGFVVGQQDNFVAYFRVNPAAVIGDSVRAYAHISAGTANAADSAVVGIRGSFDPNDKEATPTLSPAQVTHGDDIYYTIRFQNTGTDTSFNVVITDTLSSLLQAGSFEMINTSHPCITTVKDNFVSFEFINILLPDSNVNQLKSHGYVNFRIKPQSNLVVTSSIPNNAAIYFDYNSPVITNTAITTIVNPSTVPLKLLLFTVHKGTGSTANVFWQTSNEINVNGYNIEMSTDGRIYKNIVFEKAQGDQYDSYTRSVSIPNNDILYFRLKMTDIDGNYAYSNIAVLKNDHVNTSFSFLSNPAKDMLSISLQDETLRNTTATILNAQGGVVKRILLQHDVENIDIKSLAAGTYYLVTEKGSRQFIIIK